MREILVIRFGSLGDLCLLGWSLARLGAGPASRERRVTLVTKRAFAPLMAEVRGVDQVVALEGSGLGGLLNLAGQVRQGSWDTIIDAHDILRGHGLLALLGRRPDRRIRKDTVQRLALLRGASPAGSLERTMRRRFDELVEGLVDDLPETGPAPLARLAEKARTTPVLGLAPGAQWDSKRWPEENFAALLADFRSVNPAPARIFLGPREELWYPGSRLEAVASSLDDVTVIRGRSLAEIAALLAGCSALVTNDSGLLHLAEAVGTPVLAFFGPTVRQFGYFPCLPESRVLEADLDCRPCSRNGKRPCHRGDLACLREISPAAARPFLDRMFQA